MQTLTYRTGESEACIVKKEMPLIKVSAVNYNAETRPVIASFRRLLCMSMKQPNVLRVLNRQGKYTDATVEAAAVRHLSSAEARPNSNTLFYAVGGKNLAVLAPGTLASGEMALPVVETRFDEEVFAATPGDEGTVYVLGSHAVFAVNEETGKQEARLPLAAKTAVTHPAFDFHPSAHLLLTPAKNTHLDLMSTKTSRSVLTKAWEPHADTVPTFARFFTTHTFEKEERESLLLVTAARRNTELRLWSYHRTTQRFNLRQEITVVNQDDAGDEFDISLTSSEEYITLVSRRRAFAVVVEMHRTQLMAHRMTTWKMPAASLCSTTYVGKVADSVLSKSVHYELFVTLRTAEGVTQFMLDANKLVGGSNVMFDQAGAGLAAASGGGAAGAALGGAGSSVASWFPGIVAAEAASANGTAAPVTSVCSSVLGDIKSSNAIPASTAVRVVQAQTQKFCEQVRRLEVEFMAAQKNATETMRMLQDPKLREEAQSNGRRFAIRNRQRLNTAGAASSGAASAPAEPGMMSSSQRELILSISAVVKEVEGGSRAAASAALKTLLDKQLKASVDRASAELEQLEVTGPISANLNNTDATRQFKAAVDQAAREMIARVRELLQQTRTTLKTSEAETNATVQRAREFTNALRDASAQVRDHLTEVRAAVEELQSASHASAAVEPVDPHKLVEQAVREAEAGDWPRAFRIALEASDITVLLTFLESQVCADNERTITSPETLTLPHFLSLCLQLTFQLGEQPGAAPLRVQQLHRFYVEWDDTLRSLKLHRRHDSSFDLVRRELTTVLDSLNEIDVASLDRKSRNNYRLVSKLIVGLLSDE